MALCIKSVFRSRFSSARNSLRYIFKPTKQPSELTRPILGPIKSMMMSSIMSFLLKLYPGSLFGNWIFLWMNLISENPMFVPRLSSSNWRNFSLWNGVKYGRLASLYQWKQKYVWGYIYNHYYLSYYNFEIILLLEMGDAIPCSKYIFPHEIFWFLIRYLFHIESLSLKL